MTRRFVFDTKKAAAYPRSPQKLLKSLDKGETHDEIQNYRKDQREASHRENAVVVAGETLSLIQLDRSLQDKFVELCEGANVVLACRVSPK